jgi:MFS family permease
MLRWISRDGILLIAVRPLLSFANGFISVFFAVYLGLLGMPIWQIGFVLTGGLLCSTGFNFAAGFLADKVGRRKMLILFGFLAVFSGIIFTVYSTPSLLIPVAVISAMGYRGGFGPTNMLERVILAQCCPDSKRTRMYAIRSTLNSIALSAGSLFTGMIILFQSFLNIDELASYRMMFAIYTLLNLLAILFYLQLSEKAEVKVSSKEHIPTLSSETKRNVLRLSFLFSMDSFGGGLITSSLVSYWFFKRFGLDINFIGLIFSISSLLAAVSFILAARISERIGLINTMVYSHLPANMMTMSIPYMPNLASSVILYFFRALLGQMDVPTRQSYVMAISKPEERSRVAGFINLPRSLTQAISPSLAGLIMQFMGMSFPFLIAGGLKAAYDIALYFAFRNVKPPEEQ